MPRMPKPKPGLAELQNMAQAHVSKVLQTVAFKVGDLDEVEFAEVMATIMRQLFEAWAAGYAEGTKRG